MKNEILIIGAGVSGLSTSILLLQSGYKIKILAKDLPPNTTSNKAAAVWYPFIVKPEEKAAKWAGITLDFFIEHILKEEESGVYRTPVLEIFPTEEQDPAWKPYVRTFKRLDREELPAGYIDGWSVKGVGMVTDIYMNFLLNRFRSLGGIIEQKEVRNIEDALQNFDVIINCAGIGARELVHDRSVIPCRGQTIKIKHNGFPYTLFEEKGPNSLAYIIPRREDIILGGTAQDGNWNLEVDAKDTEDILRKCANIKPEFSKAEIIGYTVGLRPYRPEVRVEAEISHNGKLVVHNYGHGGSGFTISWGCALEVLDLLRQAS